METWNIPLIIVTGSGVGRAAPSVTIDARAVRTSENFMLIDVI